MKKILLCILNKLNYVAIGFILIQLAVYAVSSYKAGYNYYFVLLEFIPETIISFLVILLNLTLKIEKEKEYL